MWKELIYEGNCFLVSDAGDICRNGKLLTPSFSPDGYRRIYMRKADGRGSGLRLCRAVAMAFIPNDDPGVKTEVNHKDYNRANDCVDNLEWISHIENIRYSIKNKPDIFGQNNPNYGNRKLSKWYAEHPEDALEKQSRKDTQNGRACRLRILLNGLILGEFELIKYACEFINFYCKTNCKLDSLRGKINKSIRSGKAYKGMLFEKF
jgi:hypothetical protein